MKHLQIEGTCTLDSGGGHHRPGSRVALEPVANPLLKCVCSRTLLDDADVEEVGMCDSVLSDAIGP